MKQMHRTPVFIFPILLSVFFFYSIYGEEATCVERRTGKDARPPGATHCDLSLPIRIDLVPLDKFQVGKATPIEINIESGIDPDLVKHMWVEYEIPPELRNSSQNKMEIPQRAHRHRLNMEVRIPDKRRYQIQARLMVQLVNGKTISQTATQFIDLGNTPPDAMIGRIENPDGTGIRIYQGQPVRN
jgi:hypothetical protein